MNRFFFTTAVALLALGCSATKNASEPDEMGVMLDPIEIFDTEIYRASSTRYIDIIHTQLAVSFNWELQHMPGVADITFRPYFYNINTVDFDAQGQEIQEVVLVTATGTAPLTYTYENDVLHIALDRYYSRQEEVKVRISYVAKPNERNASKGVAITSDKGLYFINPLGNDPKVPTQVWTQGEVAANSVWFPTVDAPNERCTHQISMTVDTGFVTLSNGALKASINNGDGTRTDVWMQNKPIAPYLFMMAASNFSVVTDSLNGMEVSYYVDPEYAPYAREIFQHTPEMITFYSDLLGFPYPWHKYSQAVVHEYVSGAMENVSAVIFGDFAHQTHQEMIDGNSEATVAHELFHHWFGDVVTCESWANLPLNESFATYGEYLWYEHKYGKEIADANLDYDLRSYLRNVYSSGAVDMIRFNYNNPDDMFDSHSYAKGGRILHMLRHEVGDAAFFAALQLYLEDNAYQSVEIHNLRLAFEKVTGQDLNWFFNQWFMGKGHPILDISYTYDSVLNVQYVHVSQAQDMENWGLFQFPVGIDIYVDGSMTHYDVRVDSASQTFQFKVPEKPDLVNFESDKILVCEKTDHHSYEEMLFMYQNAPLYMDKKEALWFVQQSEELDDRGKQMILDAMLAEQAEIRYRAVSAYEVFDPIEDVKLKGSLISALQNDADPSVRAEAAYALYDYYPWADQMDVVFKQQLTSDSSFAVMAECLYGLAIADSVAGMDLAFKYQDTYSSELLGAVAEVYAAFGASSDHAFFVQYYGQADGFDKLSWARLYLDYLMRMEDDLAIQKEAIPLYEQLLASDTHWYIKNVAYQALVDLELLYQNSADEYAKSDNLKAQGFTALSAEVNAILTQVRVDEKDARVFKSFQ